MVMISRVSVKLNNDEMAMLQGIMSRHGFNRSEALRYVIVELAKDMGVNPGRKPKRSKGAQKRGPRS
jgi:hypothetical protein